MPQSLKISLAQINPTVGDINGNQEKILKFIQNAEDLNSDIVIFPELVLSGYPPEDLLLHPQFINDINLAVQHLVLESKNFDTAIIIGAPIEENNNLYNGALFIHQGEIIAKTFKRQLPNYNVFDEKRYFENGKQIENINFKGKNIILTICEDIWHNLKDYKDFKDKVDFVVSINASPYEGNKFMQRVRIASDFVKNIEAPLIYVNLVGGQDDLVFDGGSFIMDKNQNVTLRGEFFNETLISTNFEEHLDAKKFAQEELDNHLLSYEALVLATRDYVQKNNFSKVILGLSGGVDSALVATIACDALGSQNVICAKLPTQYSSEESFIDANELCNTLECESIEINIEKLRLETLSLLGTFAQEKNLNSLTLQNIQARLRMLILMSLSNETGALVLATSNKSELAVGYSTIYGDMSGGFAPLIDVYKTDLYELAKWRNENTTSIMACKKLDVIPLNVFVKSPSAELDFNQKDEDSIPPYDVLDPILKAIIEGKSSVQSIVSNGNPERLVNKINNLIIGAEFKRSQAPIGPKVNKASFCKGRRMPITNLYNQTS